MTPKEVSWKKVKHHWEIYLFILPTLALIGMFQYYPAASGVFHSFYRWNGADISEFVGWENYTDLIDSSEFWNSFKIAFFIGLWNIMKMVPAILVAVCIHRCLSERMQYFYRIMFVVPMVIPALVVVLIWRSFFFEATTGYLNKFLIGSGLFGILAHIEHWIGVLPEDAIFVAGKNPAWLGDPRLILTACIVWGFPWVGSFAVLTHLAKLQSINKDIYEAGDIDGVSWWSKFVHIEFPLITSSIYILLVFTIIDTIRDAGMILALAGLEGGPGGKVTVPALFMIRKAFVDQQMGYACAVGIVLTLVVMGLQKLSETYMGWEFLRGSQRLMFRIVTLGVAAYLFYMDQLTYLAWMLVLAALPYKPMREFLDTFVLFRALKGFLLSWGGLRTLVETSRARRMERALARPEVRLPRLHERSWSWVLRVNKHVIIWAVLAFAFLPVYLMIIVSLKNNQQFYEAPALLTPPYHWENWKVAWDTVSPAVANSIFISFGSTAATLIFALCGAYFFARVKVPFSGLFWNAILVLMIMPTIANLVPLFRLLTTLNLLNTLSALIIVGASAGQVFAIFVLRSFVADIPHDLFEAGDIDGASHFQQLRNIVLPLSGPILANVGVMQFISAWNDFVLPLIIMRDRMRLPVMVQLLRMAGEYIKLWGPLMAGYAFASLPVVILFIFCMRLFVRGMTEGAIKS